MHEFKTLQEIASKLASWEVSLWEMDYISVHLTKWWPTQKPLVFTQDMYDSSWRTMTWWNKRKGIWLMLLTENRYKPNDPFKDATVKLVNNHFIRPDINYED